MDNVGNLEDGSIAGQDLDADVQALADPDDGRICSLAANVDPDNDRLAVRELRLADALLPGTGREPVPDALPVHLTGGIQLLRPDYARTGGPWEDLPPQRLTFGKRRSLRLVKAGAGFLRIRVPLPRGCPLPAPAVFAVLRDFRPGRAGPRGHPAGQAIPP